MLRVISLFLLLGSILWCFAVRWRSRYQRQPRWPSWLVFWGLWLLCGWIAAIAHIVLVLRGPH